MAYKRERKRYNLVFADPDMRGLEVKAKSTSMGEFLEINKLSMQLLESPDMTKQDIATLHELFERFSTVLVSWNLEDEDGPVATTKDGLLTQDPEFVMEIISAWIDAVNGVDAELGKDSTSTPQFPEVSIPMDTLSTSPGS